MPSATKAAAPSPQTSEKAPVTHSSRDRVAVLAYRLWQERGCPDGSPEIDWNEAEKLISEQPVAMPPSKAAR